MTTTTTTDRTVAVASGLTPIPFDFQAISETEVGVLREGLAEYAYTVALNGDGTGVVVPSVDWGSDDVLIFSDPSFQQPTNFTRFGPMFPDQFVPPLDRLARTAISLKNRLGLTGSDASLRTDLAGSDGAQLSGWRQAGTGATTRSVRDKLRDFISIKDFGAQGNGITNDAAAFGLADAVAAAANRHILVPPGTYRIASNTPINADLVFDGGIVSVDATFTLTLRGEVSAPTRQLFAGAGSVIGLRDVCPEWWGAVGNGTVDDLIPLDKAHACVQASKNSNGDKQRIVLQGGKTYGVSGTWAVAPSADVNLIVEGAGTGLGGSRITDIAAFSSTTTPVFKVDGQTDSIQQIANWGIKDFAVVKGPGSATIGIQLGDTSSTKLLIGETWAQVENVNSWKYATGWKLCHVRMIRFNRVSAWNNGVTGATVCMEITVNGAYTSDLIFDDSCQFVSNASSNAGSRCVKIVASSGAYNPSTGVNSIGGIRFGNCDMYAAQKAVDIYCSDGAMISDIWFTETQFDQACVNPIWIDCNKNTGTTPIIQDINITNAYFAHATGDMVTLTSTGSGGIIRQVKVTHNRMARSEVRAFAASGAGVSSISFNNNHIVDNDNDGGEAVAIGAIAQVQCNNNIFSQSDGASSFGYAIAIALGATRVVCRGNDSGGLGTSGAVNDLSGAVTKSVGDNI